MENLKYVLLAAQNRQNVSLQHESMIHFLELVESIMKDPGLVKEESEGFCPNWVNLESKPQE